MAEKDMAEKALEDYNDIFADMINGLLFNGEQVVSEADLETATSRSIYEADGKLHGQERDATKYWKRRRIRITMYGMENETRTEPFLPLRLCGYDGAAYRAQLLKDSAEKKANSPGSQNESSRNRKRERNRKKKSKKYYPVVTLVLYFGFDKRWNAPKTLRECLDIPKGLEPYVNDYKMNLYEIAYLTDEQLQNFHSDFRIIADYFVQMRRGQDYVAPRETIRHVHEFMQFMSAMTGDNRFEELYETGMEKGEDATVRSIVIDKAIEEGMKKGIKEGMEKGRLDMLAGLVCESIMTLEDAASRMSLSTEEFTAKCRKYNLNL